MKKKNQMRKKPSWLWLLCPPAAALIEADNQVKAKNKKRAAKKARRREEFERKFPEFDYWQDNEDL